MIAERRLSVTTIGIGDGGNEIGMGSIPWEILRSAITVGPAALVPCRTATDFTLLAGVSDRAGDALAACLLPIEKRQESASGLERTRAVRA